MALPLGAYGWIAFLGVSGVARHPPLSVPRQRAAFMGQLAGHFGALLEVRALREQRDRYESLFRFSGDGMITVGGDLRVTGANPALERLTGWHAAEIHGRFYHDVLRMEDARGEPLGLARCPLLESFATALPVVDREVVIRARDGQRLHVAVTASAVRGEDGLVTSGILNMRDLHHQHAQDALASTVISIVSHELQTPIAIIKGYASTLSLPRPCAIRADCNNASWRSKKKPIA